MAKNHSKDEFRNAQALGQLTPLPESNESHVQKDEEIPEVINDPQTFNLAIGHAQMEGREFIEVTQKLFDFLVKKNKTPYLTYGDPGIKVFVQGTREKIEKEESMNAESHYNMVMKKKSEQATNV